MNSTKGFTSTLLDLFKGKSRQQHQIGWYGSELVFAMTVIMFKVINLVRKRIERLILITYGGNVRLPAPLSSGYGDGLKNRNKKVA